MIIQTLAYALVLQALPPAQTAKDEFAFNNMAEVESIDPHIASGVPDNNLVTQMFEGLMTRAADWATLIPGQAESYQLSPDRKVYTFKLRKNLKWSDGKPITADDFVYSWLRGMRDDTLGTYSYWLRDTIVGAKEYSAGPATADRAKTVGVKSVDPLTFQVTLINPVSYFIEFTTDAVTIPVPKHVIEKVGDQWTRPEHIVTNGPYRMKEWIVQQKIILEKNPHYYDAANVKINRIIAYPIEDRQTSLNFFRQGKTDWSGQNGAPNALVPSLRKDPNFRVNPGFTTYYYRMNVTRPPLNDIRVRQALALAIDRKELVSKVTRGGEVASDQFVPPNTGKYTSPKGLSSGDYAADVKKARELLAAAGFPGGKGMRTLQLQYNTDENHKKIAQAVQQMWKTALGISVVPYNQEWKVYLKDQKALNYDISRSAWSGDYPDAATFLEMFTSTSDNNQTGWKSAAYDKLFAETVAMPAGEARLQKLKEAENILLSESAIAPMYTYVHYGFVRPELVGFIPNPIDRPFVRFYSKK